MENEELSQVNKDLGEYYNFKVTRLLDEIDGIKEDMLNNPIKIKILNFKLHSLFIHLYHKIKKLDKRVKEDNIRKQKKMHDLFEKYKSVLYRSSKTQNEEGEFVQSYRLNKKFNFFLDLLEKRQTHLNYCLEEIGLTAKEIKQPTKSKELIQ